MPRTWFLLMGCVVLVLLCCVVGVFATPAAAVSASAALPAMSLPVKVVTLAAAIYPILQLLKKLSPGISGKWAIVFNVLLAVLGIVVTIQPDKLFTADTAFALIAAIGTAAGIHGTVKSLSSSSAQ